MSENSKTTKSRSANFVDFLRQLDRRAFAELRRSLGQAHSMSAIPYVEPFVASEESGWKRQMYYLVAGLLALVERPSEGPINQEHGKHQNAEANFGVSVAELYIKRERSGSIEQRFVRLLDADKEQLPNRMRQMVTLLHSQGLSIDWARLLDDLSAWRSDTRWVQHQWARSFYQKVAPPLTPTNQSNPSDGQDANSPEPQS